MPDRAGALGGWIRWRGASRLAPQACRRSLPGSQRNPAGRRRRRTGRWHIASL